MRPVRIITTVLFAAAVAVAGCTAHSTTAHPAAAPTPVSSAPPPTTPHPTASPAARTPAAPTTTLPLGHVKRLNGVQAIGGTATAFAVGTGTILATSNDGRTWARVWQGAQELDGVDFVSTRTGWALGEGILLGTIDGGQHWRQLGEPRVGPLRQVHFASRTQGWGVAGGSDRSVDGPQGHTTLVHTTDGGRTWTALAAPAPPQSVCFTASNDGWLTSGTSVWRSTDGGHRWRPSFTLPVSADGLPSFAELQCAQPGAAWVRFDAGDSAAGHIPYALYTSSDGGAHWRGVLAESGTLASTLRLPGGPGSYPGPFSAIDPQRAFLLSPTPAAEATGAVLVSQGGSRLLRRPDLPGTTLFMPRSVSFASATRGWAVGADLAGRAVLLATTDGGHSWHSQLPA
ncbi:MAG TPA: hypothetical protein VFA45_05080 [Actinomycetes bacterium]|jgi:photosystem II stability/assembly factor-like uncharacterized protein|nr:hypothetical protein [Actinomycetes bacterium]